MQRVPVQSSALQSVGYNPDNKTLELEFRENGDVWQYFSFPASAYRRFMNAESLGRFFVKKIKGKYVEEQVRYA
ncbi:hypothetical protein GCM10023149_31680 [Mucilaginibacter gynuensis]|uniref:KTSC domain-containing protein n=1 Tax=Mucilaginibacter gynuensis TaxID=1302236 RepID=A0ABP8GPC9_9SPHI